MTSYSLTLKSKPKGLTKEKVLDIYRLITSCSESKSSPLRILLLSFYLLDRQEKYSYIFSIYKRLSSIKKKNVASIFTAVKSASKKDFFPNSSAGTIFRKSFDLFSNDDWRSYLEPFVEMEIPDYSGDEYENEQV